MGIRDHTCTHTIDSNVVSLCCRDGELGLEVDRISSSSWNIGNLSVTLSICFLRLVIDFRISNNTINLRGEMEIGELFG